MVCKKRGFSLTELMVVVAISTILMTVAVPVFIGAKNRSNTSACETNLQIIKTAIQEWALDNPDIAVADYQIKVTDIDSYIEGGFTSLEEPYTESSDSYTNDNGTSGDTSDDFIVQINSDGSIPDPTCFANPSDHVID